MDKPERGPRARTRKLMMETATRLMQEGMTPSVSDVADAAEVSRATAYRYFPSQAALVQAVVDEALGPILSWSSSEQNVEQRVADLLETSLPRIFEFEATFRAALKLSLDRVAAEHVEVLEGERPFKRGHRMDLLSDALAPLRQSISPVQFERLVLILSMLFGIEPLVVLKDIGGLDSEKTQAIIQWAANAMVRMAISETEQGGETDTSQ